VRLFGVALDYTYDDGRFIRMEKLTLSVDPTVIARAKAYARASGTSVSRLVESMLDVASRPGRRPDGAPRASSPPVLTRLRGSLARGSVADYRRHLERKYR
jgi:hypothetical protein